MSIEWFPTANSYTRVAYDTNWLVLDLGSGHNPHVRANILVDRFLLDDTEVSGRSGRAAVLSTDKPLVVADGCAMPFRDKAFDFIICSHVAEHIEDADHFCAEVNRIGQRGYLRTPSKLAEILRHPPYHLWYVSNRNGTLIFEPAPRDYPLGWFGKLFFSIYFYRSIQLQEKDVFTFAHGVSKPWHYIIIFIRRLIIRCWLQFRSFTYTRLLWEKNFSWEVKR